MGMRRPDSAHPDTRAVMYEEAAYSKRRINGFLSALEGFKTASEIPSLFSPVVPGNSGLLKKVVCLVREGGLFPDLSEQLKFFSSSFNHGKARKEGTIIPAKGQEFLPLLLRSCPSLQRCCWKIMLLSLHPNIIVHVENVVSLFSSPSTSSQKVRKCGSHNFLSQAI